MKHELVLALRGRIQSSGSQGREMLSLRWDWDARPSVRRHVQCCVTFRAVRLDLLRYFGNEVRCLGFDVVRRPRKCGVCMSV